MRGLSPTLRSARTAGALLLISLTLACGGTTAEPAGDAGPLPVDGGPRVPFSGMHTFPAIDLAPGDERQGICQSWTLNNDEDLFVHAVIMDADEGWHHSNWAFVPETAFAGPDGTWPCRERSFDEVAAAARGGAAFFAQSTQTMHEEQRFPPGTAYRIPARSRVIGSVHVLNFSEAPRSTAISFRVETLEESAVTTELVPLVMDNRVVEIPARGTAESRMECDFTRQLGGPLDFSIYYALPHYHGYGTGMRIEVVGGPRDGAVVYETTLGAGDPLGGPIAPPFALMGATAIRVTCLYANEGPETITWGPDAADEMCTVLMYTDLGRRAGSFATEMESRETLPDGALRSTAACRVIVAP